MSSDLSFLSEKELLIKVADGDQESFRYLFDQYRNKIYSFSMYLTHSEYISEEITQEVFLKIWLTRKQLNGVEYFNAYLKTIASNIASNYLKRLANEKIILQKIAYESEQSSEITENTIIYNEYQAILKEAIQNLPPQQKKVYILSHHEGLKQDDIARSMNLSPYTVKEYMKIALSSIRRFVGGRIELAIVVAIQIFLND
jgi:RNA polymerase sigma-70 factor (family 1)